MDQAGRRCAARSRRVFASEGQLPQGKHPAGLSGRSPVSVRDTVGGMPDAGDAAVSQSTGRKLSHAGDSELSQRRRAVPYSGFPSMPDPAGELSAVQRRRALRDAGFAALPADSDASPVSDSRHAVLSQSLRDAWVAALSADSVFALRDTRNSSVSEPAGY